MYNTLYSFASLLVDNLRANQFNERCPMCCFMSFAEKLACHDLDLLSTLTHVKKMCGFWCVWLAIIAAVCAFVCVGAISISYYLRTISQIRGERCLYTTSNTSRVTYSSGTSGVGNLHRDAVIPLSTTGRSQQNNYI